MDQLFAPWRIEWVTRETPADDAGCVFCSLPTEDADREQLILARGDQAYLLVNNYPYNPGHVMVIPNRHVTEYPALDREELLGCERLVQRTIEAIGTAMDPDGFNTGRNLGRAGGGSIDHLHTHIVPRWQGDTNFMAVLDDTKVLVQALEDTYDALWDALADQPGVTTTSRDRAVSIEGD